MTVSELMREEVVTARPDSSVSEVARRMREEDVGSIVIEDNGEPVGIVTDRDLTTRILADGGDPDGRTVSDAMTESPITVPDDAGVMELCAEFGDACVRRMPVVDEDGALTGIITFDDVNKLLTDEQRELTAVIEAETPAY